MNAIRNFFRHIRDGFRNLFRNGWMTTTSIMTMTLTLIMVGGLSILLVNMNVLADSIEQGLQVRVHIDLLAESEDEAALKDEIESLAEVTGVTYRSKEEELANLIENYGSEFELFEGDSNPLYNIFVVNVEDPNQLASVAEKITQFDSVANVEYGGFNTENIVNILETSRYILAIVSAVFIVVAVLLVSNTIKATISARQTEIEIMRLVGAKNSFIRAPFAIEGALIGLIGAAFATAILFGIYSFITRAPGELLGIVNLNLVAVWPMLLYIGIGLFIIGMILGVIGARRSMKQFLKI
ncbi:permease-like cell division protein FtsX [Fundicoccus sp. Sow4_H7]|uniref:permease-like cell division protein FtsX n=1 Tax=Fundicoccus sp. Sow4_H7 TaxID=3438784 RepID=UPI003F9188D2